ncbi:MAG: dihydroneopterin aldolase [Steroidobacteraceae bacterium]|jgi:dihydroneopterin aldolase|nr:dihydroneopterin aldolase [Gammaproteobacteria bacterium]
MTRQQDKIFIRGLEIECIIGFIDWERRVKQKVVLDIELPVDCAHTAKTDAVADTLDYKQVVDQVVELIADSSFMLVETMAQKVAELIIQNFSVNWVRVVVNKPGAIRELRDVGVSIERYRDDGGLLADK